MNSTDPLNMTDAEFGAAMAEITKEICGESDRIPGNEFWAIASFAKKYKVRLGIGSPEVNESTTRRIADWFTSFYGERLTLDWDFGRTVVLLRDEIWKIRGLRFYGILPLICSPIRINIQNAIGNDGIQIRNVLEHDHVVGLAPDLAASLSVEECNGVLEAYGQMFLTFSRLDGALDSRCQNTESALIREAIHDLILSVENLLTATPSYGRSKWSSLKATEKVVRSCIREMGHTVSHGHGLQDLCEVAERAGSPAIDRTLVAAVECSPSIRYDSTEISKEEALAAHYAALKICGNLALILQRRTTRSAVTPFRIQVSNELSLEGLKLSHVSAVGNG